MNINFKQNLINHSTIHSITDLNNIRIVAKILDIKKNIVILDIGTKNDIKIPKKYFNIFNFKLNDFVILSLTNTSLNKKTPLILLNVTNVFKHNYKNDFNKIRLLQNSKYFNHPSLNLQKSGYFNVTNYKTHLNKLFTNLNYNLKLNQQLTFNNNNTEKHFNEVKHLNLILLRSFFDNNYSNNNTILSLNNTKNLKKLKGITNFTIYNLVIINNNNTNTKLKKYILIKNLNKLIYNIDKKSLKKN